VTPLYIFACNKLMHKRNFMIFGTNKLHKATNDKKSNLIKFGHDYNKDDIDTLKLNGCDVTWVNRLKYLSIHIVSGKLINIDVSDTIRKLYDAANAIA